MDRVLARFPSPALKLDVLQGAALPGRSGRFAKALFSQPDTLVLDVDDEGRERLRGLGAVLYEDVQFRVLPGDDDEDPANERFASWSGTSALDAADAFTLHDVLNDIRAPEAWRTARGRGVTVAVVDTGIADGLREVEATRRSPIDLKTTFSGQHWQDHKGHGSMCAAIAAGSTRQGGRYNGVVPDADVLAARSTLSSTDFLDIYDDLFRLRKQNQLKGPLVVTNSYGLYTCTAPHILPEDHPFISGVLTLIDDGVFVCFAAGNNHYDECQFDPTQCGPNTIWGANSHDQVVSVGTVNRNLTNCDPATPHVSSSRGPENGELLSQAGLRRADLWRSLLGRELSQDGVVGHVGRLPAGGGTGGADPLGRADAGSGRRGRHHPQDLLTAARGQGLRGRGHDRLRSGGSGCRTGRADGVNHVRCADRGSGVPLVRGWGSGRLASAPEVSLFLRFSTSDARDSFLRDLKEGDPDLYQQAKASFAQPTVLTIRSTNEGEERRIRKLANSIADVKLYEDVTFRTFDPVS